MNGSPYIFQQISLATNAKKCLGERGNGEGSPSKLTALHCMASPPFAEAMKEGSRPTIKLSNSGNKNKNKPQ